MSETLLKEMLGSTSQILDRNLHEYHPDLATREVGTVTYIGPGVVRVRGLRGVKADELILFPGSRLGMAFNVAQTETGVVLLDESGDLDAGDEAERTDRVLDVPVGESLLGRVVDGMGRPLDDRGAVKSEKKLPVERPAPEIMDRLPVTVPLQTGLKVVDALIPVGRGQRELIIGDRQTGKTAIAVDTILNQKKHDVVCIYCAIGKRSSAVAQVVADLRERGAMAYSV
ncbi:MAG TPA: F0F1 ATP synthase subunit alpha, partial [Desulfobacteraceae bacterium]|nr:F0F1 ATP synthase subunit alpha [Desulfobacteraceae bacterium]